MLQTDGDDGQNGRRILQISRRRATTFRLGRHTKLYPPRSLRSIYFFSRKQSTRAPLAFERLASDVRELIVRRTFVDVVTKKNKNYRNC